MFIELSDREVELLIDATLDKFREAIDKSLDTGNVEKKKELYRLAEEYKTIQDKLLK